MDTQVPVLFCLQASEVGVTQCCVQTAMVLAILNSQTHRTHICQQPDTDTASRGASSALQTHQTISSRMLRGLFSSGIPVTRICRVPHLHKQLLFNTQ